MDRTLPKPLRAGHSGAIAVVAALTAASGLWVALDLPSRRGLQPAVRAGATVS